MQKKFPKFHFKIILILFSFIFCFTSQNFYYKIQVKAAETTVTIPNKRNPKNNLVLTTGYNKGEKETPYINTTLTGLNFNSSIPNGAIINNQVKFVIPNDIQYKMYKNDQDFSYKSGTFTSPKSFGYFTLVLTTVEEKEEARVNQIEERFVFQICDSTFSQQNMLINAPIGFYISSVKKIKPNSEEAKSDSKTKQNAATEVTLKSKNLYKLEEEMIHFITFTLNADKNVKYTTEILKQDTVKDLLKIDGVKNNKAVKQTVTYEAKEGSKITVKKDGKIIDSKGEINQPGNYTISVMDETGETVEESFKYNYKPNATTYILIVVIIAAIIGIPLYISRLKNFIKIR